MQRDWVSQGFTLLKNVLSELEAETLQGAALAKSGLTMADYSSVEGGVRAPFYKHGAIASTPDVWPFLVHHRLVAGLRDVIGRDCQCLPGIDTMAVHCSEATPHRDVSISELPSLASGIEEYSVARAICYPGCGSRFALIAGSQHLGGATPELTKARSFLWIEVGSRDVLLFDPRIVHCGSALDGPRVMLVATFGRPNAPTIETYFHARIRTVSLGFADVHPDLELLLRSYDLLLDSAQDQALWSHYRAVWTDIP